MTDVIAKIRRGVHKPPRVILQRAAIEFRGEADRFLSPWEPRRLTRQTLAHLFDAPDFDRLWDTLAARPYFTAAASACSENPDRIMAAAELALKRRVDLLGTGPIDLGTPIDWHCDFKTGHRWPPAYFRSIEYTNLDRPSDVKIPWEISRLQWLIPAAQAYRLTGDERYAECVRDILIEWIEGNPYAHSVNWTCTMEAALRILTFTWLFHALHDSRAWSDDDFRFRFLSALFLHARFTERHLERSDIAGNHFTADAAGLAFAGLFFGAGRDAARWASLGWRLLCDELPRQVTADGVDFEASTAYHRLVHELFLFPALYRRALGLPVAEAYQTRLDAMARFTAAFTRDDGSVPLWGDADDGCAFPRNALSSRARQQAVSHASRSQAFREGGFYVMRNGCDHVFIDCGPVGLGGRGGHGHNDCLSFEAVLDGTPLVTDCGAYVYTASATERNLFRSTAYHNTPMIDGQEINRFVAWDALWSLHYDAIPTVRKWSAGLDRDEFVGAHAGSKKLPQPVLPVRRITLDHTTHALTVRDEFEGDGSHSVEIPMHLSPGVSAELSCAGQARLQASGKFFDILWTGDAAWQFSIEAARVSPSYGVVVASTKLVWRRDGPLVPLEVTIRPAA